MLMLGSVKLNISYNKKSLRDTKPETSSGMKHKNTKKKV